MEPREEQGHAMDLTDTIKKRSVHDPSVQRYLKELRKYPPMSREEEEETLERARKGDRKAVDHLITSNLRFVVSVALEYQGRGVPLSDLIAEGNVGLMEALKRFDPGRGYKFISYAVWWIRQAILNALKRTSAVAMPANRQEDMDRMARRWGQMTQELGRVPTLDEVASDMKISRQRAERALRCVRSDLSLESPLDASGEQTLLQVLSADEPGPDRRVLERDRLERVTECLDGSLDRREAEVIRAYFGLDGKDRRTLGEIGAGLGVTRERVRQIRNRALAKLRRYFRQRGHAEESWEELV
ncbi:MAG: RNA polymerase sigma factor RpoD/SigA [Candidatus Latescibacteria bacterium]|nr:RNA polymerase sigma factor RpoD/SigA [Candidatus Latescibacterota bacterium]